MQSSPDQLIIVTGFGDKGIPELADSLRIARPALEIHTLAGCPPDKAAIHPQEIIGALTDRLEPAPPYFALLGHSYGALLALAAACRRRMQGISNLILVDGPLRPDVEVNPPQDGSFDRFALQYEHRVDTARRCMAVIRDLPMTTLSRIVTIGNTEDRIVPPEAKNIPGGLAEHRVLRKPALQGHSLSPAKIEALTRFLVERVTQPRGSAQESPISPAY